MNTKDQIIQCWGAAGSISTGRDCSSWLLFKPQSANVPRLLSPGHALSLTSLISFIAPFHDAKGLLDKGSDLMSADRLSSPAIVTKCLNSI